MKDIKKRWEQELDDILPPLRPEVVNVPLAAGKRPKRALFSALSTAFGRRGGIIAGAAAAVIVLCLLLPGLLTAPQTAVTPAPAVVLVQINPGALFSVDEEGIVTQVVAANADADVVLSQQERCDALVGIPLEQATEKFVDFALELGYLDPTRPGVIRVSACRQGDALSGQVQAALEEHLCSIGAYIAVAAEDVSAQELSERAGLVPAESLEQLRAALRETATYYFQRHQEQWEQTYADATDLEARLEQLAQRIRQSALISDNLKQLLLEDLPANLERIIALLGLDSTASESYQIPTTAEEYIQRIRNYCADKAVQYGSAAQERTALTWQEYEDFVASLIEKYGSLQAYWESEK